MSTRSHEDPLTSKTGPAAKGDDAVGVDVGGSGIRAVLYRREDASAPWRPRGRHALDRARGAPLAPDVARCVRHLLDAERDARGTSPRCCVAAPGRRTADARGIAFAHHVPAEPQLLDELARRLPDARCTGRLVSDADALLAGDQAAAQGEGRAQAALLLCPGTGLGQAARSEAGRSEAGRSEAGQSGTGRIEPPGASLEVLARRHGWRHARALERSASLAGLTRAWRDARPRPTRSIEDAAADDPRAQSLLERFRDALGLVLRERLEAWDGPAPAVVLRTRRGRFFRHPAVRNLVLPPLAAIAREHAASLRLPTAATHADDACLGAVLLAWTSHDSPPPHRAR